MESLSAKEICKSFRQKIVLSRVSFSLNQGEYISILGPSGCGKTTLLRIIAGLEKCDYGKILFNGVDITSSPPSLRNIGMVFQNYSLFPNMTVYQNIVYALQCKKEKMTSFQSDLVQEVIQKSGLREELKKYPSELSGGQQQRTAIARALVMAPKVLLLDAPFSALDSALRQNLRKLVKQLQKDLQISMIYVTHDQEEAFTLSDRILVIYNGEVQQYDTPLEIFNRPSNEYVKRFAKDQISERFENLRKIVQPEITACI